MQLVLDYQSAVMPVITILVLSYLLTKWTGKALLDSIFKLLFMLIILYNIFIVMRSFGYIVKV